MSDRVDSAAQNFIEEIIEADRLSGRWGGRVHTRFPPEPNGYLHVGHAKSICLNYGLAEKYGGLFNLRFDDTNPVTEEQEYVESIVRDIRWLGARWPGMSDADPLAGVLFASDYFEQMYKWAVELIRKGQAYVCDLTGEQVSLMRGTLTAPGRDSPTRNRSVEENLDLFDRMRRGEFPAGSRTLRARIDMAHPNVLLRDPIMYRIVHAHHHRSGDRWCIYPTYDWAHGNEDSIEGITHSICTLEFENHRPLYDWFLSAINEGRTEDGAGPWGRRIAHPQQIEFARGNLSHTVMSKRKLLHLVREKRVRGWDDPRMPTLAALRRRGYTASSIRAFWGAMGVNRVNSVIDMVVLENALRDELNRTAQRRMAVLRPLKLVIENWGEHGDAQRLERLRAINNPEDPSAGDREVPFGRELYIEQDDFRDPPPPKFHRLAPGVEVRLRYAYLVRCTDCVRDPATGEVTEVRCTYDPATRGGDAPDGRKVKGTIHWVAAASAVDAEVRLYEPLFNVPYPEDVADAGADEAEAAQDDAPANSASAASGPGAPEWMRHLNPNSLLVLERCKLEPCIADAAVGERFQFERMGYFCVDADSAAGRLVFNRSVTLKDSWAKIEKKAK